MLKNIRLLWTVLLITSLCLFTVYAEEQAADETVIETEDSETVTAAEQIQPQKTSSEAEKAGKAAERTEKEQRRQEKLDLYQDTLFRKLEMKIDGYNVAAAIPVLDMYRHRMLRGGAGCVVTGSIMLTLAPVMMTLGGVFAFDSEYGGSVIKFDDNSITFIEAKKDMLGYFIPGAIVFGAGITFNIIALIITPMCAIYFSKAHKTHLVLRRLKGLAILQGIGVDCINYGENEKISLSMGFKI